MSDHLADGVCSLVDACDDARSDGSDYALSVSGRVVYGVVIADGAKDDDADVIALAYVLDLECLGVGSAHDLVWLLQCELDEVESRVGSGVREVGNLARDAAARSRELVLANDAVG
jgi:hypothetical protein